MEENRKVMDKNKVPRRISIGELRPVVAFANYTDVLPGAVWGEREIPDFELILAIEGRFAYECAGTPTLFLEAGDVLLIPPHVRHTFRRLDEPRHAVFSCIHGELLPGARWGRGDYRFQPEPRRVTHTRGDAAIHDLFRRCRDTHAGYARYRTELLESILKEIWIRLAEYWSGGQAGPPSGRVKAMADYLRRHLREPVSRRVLAREFSVTPEHVNALFRKHLGVTPTQFVHRERVRLAYRYLRDDGLSVKEVAARVGFDDPFYFSRVFRRVLMRNPSSVR
jgi:AraC-like DNA-binding protein/quercetin dioxygenase-like cupin family protein